MTLTKNSFCATLFDARSKIPFTLRLLRKGDAYGKDFALIHDGSEPLVEFYDARFEHDPPFGQFVSRYYLSTLLSTAPDQGINLAGGVPAWTLHSKTFGQFKALLSGWSQHLPEFTAVN